MSSRRSKRRATNWTEYLAEPGQAVRLPLDILLVVMLLFAAFNFGATEAWSQQIVCLLVVFAAVYTLLLGLARPMAFGRVGSWTYVPIVLFTVLVFLQTVPLPSGVVQAIAPGTYETRAVLFSDLGGPQSSMMPLSLMPAATSRLIWAWVPVVTVFLIVLQAYRSDSGVRRVCQIMMVCAGAAVVHALFQNITGAGPRFSGQGEHLNSGPFLNYSHFGQFVNLGIGAAIGLALFQLNSLFKKYRQPAKVWSVLSKEKEYFGTWLSLLLVVCGALAITLSMTRAGVISLLFAGGFVGTLLARSDFQRRHSASVGGGKDKSAILLGVGLIIVTLSLTVGFDRIYERAATLKNVEVAAGRLQILEDIVPAISNYPIFGAGFGTFEYVFPKYDSEVRISLTTHAENEYAHMLFEVGFLGVAAIGLFLVMILMALRPVIWRPVRSSDYIAFGLLFGWVAILIHSLSDFGQHVPAVAMMTAMATGTILNMSALYRVRPTSDDGNHPMQAKETNSLNWAATQIGPAWLRIAGTVMIIGFAGLGVTSVVALEGPRKAQGEYAAGVSMEGRIYGSDPELIRTGDDERMIRRFAAAAQLDPSNPLYAYKRDYYDWGLIAFDESGNPIDLTSADSEDLDQAKRVLDRINASRRSAPTYGPYHLLAGEAMFFGLKKTDEGARLVAVGHDLTPHDPHAAFTAGLVAAELGNHEEAKQYFDHAAKLSSHLRLDVVSVYVSELNNIEAAYDLASGDARALTHLRKMLIEKGGHEATLAQIEKDVRAILEARVFADNPRPADLVAMATIRRRDGKHGDAIKLYQRAIALAPREVRWRLELGEIYVEQGKHEAAVREARAVLQLRPDSQRASRMLHDQIVYIGSDGPNKATE